MAITIFEKKDCKGQQLKVEYDLRDLKNKPADKPGSIQLTSPADSVLLFKNDDWHEGALYIRGPKTVNNLGSAKDGGRFGFGNCIRSVRITPFTLKLNITVVKSTPDNYPGIWPNDIWATGGVEDVVARANDFLKDKQAMINLEIARIRYRVNAKHFEISGTEGLSYPSEWKEPHEVDLIFINRFGKVGTGGRTKPPCFGKTVVVAARVILGDTGEEHVMTNQQMAVSLLHELGHYLGLGHGTADGAEENIMYKDLIIGIGLAKRRLRPDQIREMHDRLANHHTRRGDRIE